MRLGLASLCHTGKSHGNLDRENTVLSLIPRKIRIAMRLQNSRCTSCNDLTNPNGRGLYKTVYSSKFRQEAKNNRLQGGV